MNTSSRSSANLYLNYLVVVLAFSIPLYREWVSITAPLIMIIWLFEGRLRDKIHVIKNHTLSVAILLFFGLNLVSVLWSSHPIEGLIYVDKYRYLWLVPVIATSLRENYKRLALNAFLIGTTISLALSYAVFLGLIQIGNTWPRNPSPTMNHLDFSIVLAFAALLVADRLLRTEQIPRARLLWACYFLVIAGGLFINIGKSGQFALVGTLLVMVPVRLAGKSWRAAIVGLAVTLAVLILASLWIPGLDRRRESIVADVRQSTTEARYEGNLGKRIAGSIVALDMVGERPVLGTGVADNMVEFRRLLDTRYPHLRDAVYWFPHFHNQYLQVATELGIVGLISFGFVFYGLFRGPYGNPEDRNIAMLLGCVFLLGFLGDPFLRKQLPLVLFATIAGIVSANGQSLFWRVGAPTQPPPELRIEN